MHACTYNRLHSHYISRALFLRRNSSSITSNFSLSGPEPILRYVSRDGFNFASQTHDPLLIDDSAHKVQQVKLHRKGLTNDRSVYAR